MARLVLRRIAPSRVALSRITRVSVAATAIAIALGASGCLRQNFDLCAQDPPHPECALVDAALDGGPDAGPDAGPDPDASP